MSFVISETHKKNMFGRTKIDNYIDNSFEDHIVHRKTHLFKIPWHA